VPRPSKKETADIRVYISTSMICRLFWYAYTVVVLLKRLHQQVVARLTEHGNVITPLLRRAPRLSLALGTAPAKASPVYRV